MADRIFYFAYGALAHEEIITALLGRKPDVFGTDTKLKDFNLARQSYTQLPYKILKNAPTKIAPRAILYREWGLSFWSHTIVRSKGSWVRGLVYEITKEERELIAEWELVPWGWFAIVDGVPVHGGGIHYCTTEMLRPGQSYIRGEDELVRPDKLLQPLFASVHAIADKAHAVRKEFRARAA